jgi:nucleotide-binding universal stress UspA family protein
MKLLQHIMVPVDFRESSLNAFRYAAEVAELFNSKLTVLHVIQERNLSSETERMLRESVENRFEDLVEPLKPSLRARVGLQLARGVIFEQIVKTAIEQDINVIIAGAGSDAENESFKLSTILEKLMRKNQVPLWVVKNKDKMPVQNILCPVDLSDASERALQNAITLASKLKANLTVMNVYTPIHIQSARIQVDNKEENEKLKQKQKEDLENFLRGFDTRSQPFQLLFEQGDPFQVIRSSISRGEYDLLIMGTTGRTGLSRILMGSVTEKVTRELPCSFITTKSKDITRTYFESNLGEIETYLHKARHYYETGEYEKSVEVYSAGLKQFPDNIPMLIGLMKVYKDKGEEDKASFFRDYAQDLVTRMWGVEYIDKLGLD